MSKVNLYKKVNFDVPYINETGEITRQMKLEKHAAKIDAQGTIQQVPVLDANKQVVFEDVKLKDLLVRIVATPYEGDDKLKYDDKVSRGRLARKIARNAEVNYQQDELNLITELVAKGGANAVALQVDEILNGETKDEDDADEDKAPKKKSA